MADDLIESIIDTGKIKVEIDFLKKNLDEMKATIMTFPVIKTDIGNANGVKELSTANIKLAESHKAVEQLVKARFASEAKLVTLQTDYAKATAANTTEIQKQNKELKDQAAFNAANTGSIEKARAAVKMLNTERNKLNLYTKEGQARQKELNEQIDKYNEFIKKNVDALSQQKINVGNYQGSAKLIVDALEKEKKKLEELEKTKIRVQNAGSSFQPSGVAAQRTTVTGFGGGGATGGLASGAKTAATEIENLNQEIEKSRTIVQGFQRITDQPTFLQMASNIGDANKELKFFTKSLIEMERQGQGNSEAAIELRKHLAGLTDEIGDAKAEIKALSSDTRSFDLFAGSVSFAADAMQTFAGAAVLAGASEEDAAEATKTLVAVQSVANGVKGVANELTTRGTAANKVYAFAQKQVALSMDTTATAGVRLRAVLATIGIGAIIVGIGLLITNFQKIKEAVTGTTKAQAAYNETLEDYRSGAQEALQTTNKVKVAFNQARDGVISKEEALKIYNETLGDSFGKTKSLAEAEKLYNEKAGDYIKIMGLKAQANALFAKSAEAAAKGITAANEDQVSLMGEVSVGLQTFFLGVGAGTMARIDAQNKGVEQAKQEAKRNADDLQKEGERLATEAQKLANASKIIIDPEKEKKAEKAKKEAKQKELDAEFEMYKINQQRKIDFLKEDTDNEAKAHQDRLNSLQNYIVARLNLIDRMQAEEKKLSEDKAAADLKDATPQQAKVIKENAAKELLVIDAKYNDDRVRLFREGNQKLLDIETKYAEDHKKIATKINADTLEGLKKAIKEQEELDKKRGEKILQDEKDMADKKKALQQQLYSEIQATVFQFFDDNLKRQEQNLDEEQRLLDEDTQRRINNINQLGLTEIERVKQTAAVEKNAAFQSEQIEKKKRAIQVERAKFEKAASIASIIQSTAVAVIAALGMKPYTPANIALAALTGAIGALQLAKAISTPLPKYEEGTESARKGDAITGERGRELIIPRSGRPYLSPAVASLTSLIGGEKIIPADMTANILNAAGKQRLAGLNPNKAITADTVNAHLMSKMLGELKDLNKHSRIIVKNSPGIETTAWYAYHFKN